MSSQQTVPGRAFFARPAVSMEDYRAWLLHYTTNFVLVALAAHAALTIVAGSFQGRHGLAAGFVAIACIAARIAMVRNRIVIGGALFVGTNWVASVALITQEGWASPSTDVFFLVLVGSAAMLGRWGALCVSGATIVVVLAAGLAAHKGWITPVPITSAGALAVGWVSMLASIGLILFMLVGHLERTLAKAKHSEERYAAMVRESPDAIVVFDAQRTLVTASPAIERITGYTTSELHGIEVGELPFLMEEDKRAAADRYEAAKQGLSDAPIEYTILHRDGARRTIETNHRYVRRQDGTEVLQATLRDISARREAEQATRQLESQLHHAQRLESIGQLAGGVAHEFNNCLTAIRGGIDLARRSKELSGEVDRDLEMAYSAALRASDVTKELLAFARTGSQTDTCLVSESLSQLHGMIGRLVGEDIELTVQLDATQDRVRISRTHLEQVVVNLVVNASDAMAAGGSISVTTKNVTTSTGAAEILMSVTDTGPGMPDDVKARIFEPFFTTKGVGHGTGLGLSVVHGIVTRAGGKIEVDSEPGRGTAFRVRLPITDEQPGGDHVEAPTTATTGSGDGRSSSRTWTILLIEDDAAVAKAAARMLRRLNHTVFLAGNGDDAMALVGDRERNFDVILTDVVLCNERGPDVVARISTVLPGLPVLYMSGYTAGSLAEHGIGPEQLVEKPFSATDLLVKIDAVVQASDSSST